MDKQPKVLIISNNALSRENANGKTLVNLFQAFSKENIAQFYIRPELPQEGLASHYFRITDKEKLISVFKKNKPLGKEIISSNDSAFSSVREKKFFEKKKFIETGWARWQREKIWKKSSNPDGLHQFVIGFKPDVILLYASRSAFMIHLATDLSLQYGIPLVVFTGEDEYFHKVPWYKLYSRKCLKNLKKAYQYAASNAARFVLTHEKLASLFEKELHVSTETIYQTSGMSFDRPEENKDEKPSFVYAGNLTPTLRRHESILDIANSLGEIDYSFKLDIYPTNTTASILKKLGKNEHIVLHEPVSSNELKTIIQNATVVIHTESFSSKVKGMVENGFSAKIPDLLACGRPILIYAPEYCSFFEYLKKNNVAVCVSSKEALASNLKEIIFDRAFADEKVKNAIALSTKNHNLEENGKKLFGVVENASHTKVIKRDPQFCENVRKLRLNRWVVPFLFVYFVLSLFPTISQQLTFLPNIFTSSTIELAWKGLLFATFSSFFLVLMIKNKIKLNWILLTFLGIYALSNLVAIALIPASTILSSDHTGALLTYEVVVTTANKISGIFQVLSTVVLSYVFVYLLPKTLLFKKQLNWILYLLLFFIVISGLYSFAFEKDTILGMLASDNPFYFDVHSFFENKNTYGKYLFGGIMIATYLATQSKVKWQFGVSDFLFVCLITSLSKTPIMATVALFGILFIYYVIIRFERHVVVNSIMIAGLLLVISYAVGLLFIPALQVLPIGSKLYHYITVLMFQFGLGTVDTRVLIWQSAVELFQGGHVFFGYGEKIASLFLLGETTVFQNYPNPYFHNGILQVMTVGGLAFLTVYLCLFIYLISVYLRIGKKDKDARFTFIALFIAFNLHATFEEAILSNTSVYSFLASMVLVVAPIMQLRMQETDYIGELKKDVMTNDRGQRVYFWGMIKPKENDYENLPLSWYHYEFNRRAKNRLIKKIEKEEKYNEKMKRWRQKHALYE